ncbi:DNA repair protein RecN [Thalassomonas actiniarum]|uniref:DNA repair protein RecN n=1 Tax=Thalassomonas actiniarum TaxID=485447 RepID=A0AAE9YTC9_9GAMM|nr:DNA repair protein RecN [Thalassomonas actiniarum]WDE00836.1 DNA repair protein RecN [Thalassomonas actiniarum]
MLLHLNIQNFAIVRSLDIDWNHGMTTITGETGAGKSIAIDALGLCLGERALTNVVRPGCKKAELSAVFGVLANPAASKWLEQHDLNGDDECILRRVVSAEGRSRAYINGSQVPLAQLKELGQLLINIHGQHDHQQIVKAAEQRRMLDDYAGHQHLMDDVKYHHQKWRELTAELKQLQENKLQRDAKQQLLQYQVSELDEFALQPEEFETLETDYKRYSNSQHLLNETLMSLQQLSDNEEFNVLDSLRRSCDSLSALTSVDSSLSGIAKVLEEAQIQIDDACNDLRQYYDRLELDPETFHFLEERYSQAIQLAKKHQLAPENLPDFHSELARELANISSDESRLSAMGEEIEKARQSYLDVARVLSDSRQKQAKKLGALISTSMQELNMPHGEFQARVEQNPGEQLSVHGIDEVSFVVSINPGQPLEAMNKVASGGELSRISLAMQVILADKVVTPSLIFDEVDVGISGPTASMVGSKLQQLAKNTQVICVTHLPQVASKGHQQLFVAKLTDGEHTETKVTELSEPARIKEIARLLAGDKITEHSLANAQELLAG